MNSLTWFDRRGKRCARVHFDEAVQLWRWETANECGVNHSFNGAHQRARLGLRDLGYVLNHLLAVPGWAEAPGGALEAALQLLIRALEESGNEKPVFTDEENDRGLQLLDRLRALMGVLGD